MRTNPASEMNAELPHRLDSQETSIDPASSETKQASIADQPLSMDVCPYCKQVSGILVEFEPDERMPNFSIHHYTCRNTKCGMAYDKQSPG